MATTFRAIGCLSLLMLGVQACADQPSNSKSQKSENNIPPNTVEFALGEKAESQRYGKPACELMMHFRNGTNDTVRIDVRNYEARANGEVVMGGFSSFGISPGQTEDQPKKFAGECDTLGDIKMREVFCDIVDDNGSKTGDCSDKLVLKSAAQTNLIDLRRR